mgnify:CR=1 FL=1
MSRFTFSSWNLFISWAKSAKYNAECNFAREFEFRGRAQRTGALWIVRERALDVCANHALVLQVELGVRLALVRDDRRRIVHAQQHLSRSE